MQRSWSSMVNRIGEEYDWFTAVSKRLDKDAKDLVYQCVVRFGYSNWLPVTAEEINTLTSKYGGEVLMQVLLTKGYGATKIAREWIARGLEQEILDDEDWLKEYWMLDKFCKEETSKVAILRYRNSSEYEWDRNVYGLQFVNEEQEALVRTAKTNEVPYELVKKAMWWPTEWFTQVANRLAWDRAIAGMKNADVWVWYVLHGENEVANALQECEDARRFLAKDCRYTQVVLTKEDVPKLQEYCDWNNEPIGVDRQMSFDEITSKKDGYRSTVESILGYSVDWLENCSINKPGVVAANLRLHKEKEFWDKFKEDVNKCLNLEYDWGSYDAKYWKTKLKLDTTDKLQEALVAKRKDFELLKLFSPEEITENWERIAAFMSVCNTFWRFTYKGYTQSITRGVLLGDESRLEISLPGPKMKCETWSNPTFEEFIDAVQKGYVQEILAAYAPNVVWVGGNSMILYAQDSTGEAYGLIKCCDGKKCSKEVLSTCKKLGVKPVLPENRINKTVTVCVAVTGVKLPWVDNEVVGVTEFEV